ncbi:MAG: universal stress protein [Deltaproteobacteria bacterium HGW-Deltaproteobacteria-15]|jgi:nucleotide-binding universal stress UspA family protein|nr:MAG: universal stress protein [Deltaproteobacteria bacterium HGW-Deltaproteobacteria-15]
MEVKRILWPTDFSRTSEEALPYVTSLTRKYDAEVHVLYVIEDLAHHEGWYGEFGRENVQKLMAHSEKTARQRLDQLCEKYMEGCPLYVKHVAIGDPAQEILELIGKEQIDLIVMTSRGERSAFSFGSVSEKVVKNSQVPVIVIPLKSGMPKVLGSTDEQASSA